MKGVNGHIASLRPNWIVLTLAYSLTLLGSLDLGASQNSEEVYYVPVVFHIVYSDENQNITLEQIDSQLATLNKDFRAINSDIGSVIDEFNGSVADAKIEFVKADQIISSPTDPIIRKVTSVEVFKDSDLFSSEKGGSNPYSPEKYLNVWVANLADGLLGFYHANGVAVDFKSFGTKGKAAAPYNLGRTLTHELGHFLSLQHLWGLGGCDSDDGIEDTPNQSSAHSGCSENFTSCGTLDMFQNFMNTSTDECLLFFTTGQVEKMRSYISSNYPEFIHSNSDLILRADQSSSLIGIYPNPSSSGIYKIRKNTRDKLLANVASLEGKHLENYLIEDDFLLDLSHLPKGTYILKITNHKSLTTEKIIIK
ncbi:zinc-dependent metalloprotease [Ekhidna sp.]|uniref:zinc-dependent metalloprotease n=1 Tax=Ekhidna sp. TaxID=2608089 RepID=UPI0035166A76